MRSVGAQFSSSMTSKSHAAAAPTAVVTREGKRTAAGFPSIGQVGAGEVHGDPDLAERMRDWRTEFGDADADAVDQGKASQQADRDGLAERFQRLIFHL